MTNRPSYPTLPLPTGTTIDILTPDLVRLTVPLPQPNLPGALTAAQQEIARLVFMGASNAGIARARRVSLRTVNKQVEAIFTKLAVSSRAELVLAMLGLELPSPSRERTP